MILQTFSTDISKMKTKLFFVFFKFSSLEQLWALKSIACVLFVSERLDGSGERTWFIHKITQIFRGFPLLFTPYLSDRELFDSTENDFKVDWSLSQCNRAKKYASRCNFFKFEFSHFFYLIFYTPYVSTVRGSNSSLWVPD